MDSWLIILITLIGCSFFAGMEIAFVSANKFKIELESKNGHWGARLYSYFLKHQSKYITTMLLGSNVALVIYGIAMAALLEPPIHSGLLQLGYHAPTAVVILIQTIVSTLIILVTAEFIPKSLFRLNPNAVLSALWLPMAISYGLLLPFVYVTSQISKVILKYVMKIDYSEEKPNFGRIDLDNYVREHSSGAGDTKEEIDHEIQIFQNALDFKEVKARDCMVPRTQIVAVDKQISVDGLKAKFIETGLSKILVYDNGIDDISGYVHSFDLFQNPQSVEKITRPVIIIPETVAANQVLSRFIQERKSVAVVVDEFGGTSGIITMEDVMEEIFGEIDDEHDIEELTDAKIGENEYTLSAHLEIEYLNDKYNLGFAESEEYETLAGFIISHHEDIPEKDEVIVIDHYRFTVISVQGSRIELVNLKVNKAED